MIGRFLAVEVGERQARAPVTFLEQRRAGRFLLPGVAATVVGSTIFELQAAGRIPSAAVSIQKAKCGKRDGGVSILRIPLSTIRMDLLTNQHQGERRRWG